MVQINGIEQSDMFVNEGKYQIVARDTAKWVEHFIGEWKKVRPTVLEDEFICRKVSEVHFIRTALGSLVERDPLVGLIALLDEAEEIIRKHGKDFAKRLGGR